MRLAEEVKKKIAELVERPLVSFAIESGTAVVVLAICWCVVTIVKLLLVA